jgi:hypothetical protein
MALAVTVTIDDQRISVDKAAKLLADAGLRVASTMETLGLVSGSVDSKNLAALRSVPGVLGVELQREVGIAPPDSDVQ